MTTDSSGRALSLGWTTVDYEVALEIASHEAIIRQAYKDSEDVWTWSVGLTSATGHDVTRYIGKPQTLEHCLAVYAWALENYAQDVRDTFAGYRLTKAQFTAALSFHWNTGAIKRASWVKLWRTGDMAGARKAFMEWNKPSSIIGRRTKECTLFFDGKWSNDGRMTEYTRVKSNGTPDWASAKRINVEQALRTAFPDPGPVPVVDAVPPPPDIEPVPARPAANPGWLALVLGFIMGVIHARKA